MCLQCLWHTQSRRGRLSGGRWQTLLAVGTRDMYVGSGPHLPAAYSRSFQSSLVCSTFTIVVIWRSATRFLLQYFVQRLYGFLLSSWAMPLSVYLSGFCHIYIAHHCLSIYTLAVFSARVPLGSKYSQCGSAVKTVSNSMYLWPVYFDTLL